MITTDMRLYNYFIYEGENELCQPVLSDSPAGQVRMAINISSQSIQDNINYQNCAYVGLTHAKVDDTYVIEYGNERLKVKYVNPKGRFNQVFLERMG